MTNSFQPQAQPVDTFVRPVSVAPPTDLDVLARALKTVNPGIEAFLGNKMDEAIEDEQAKGRNIAIQEELDKGTFGKIVSKVRKKDGENAANQLVGGSIFAHKAYGRQRAINASLSIDNNLQTSYKTDLIDILDDEGNTTQIRVNELSPTSPEFLNWERQKINTVINNISSDVDEKILNDYFYPKLQTAITNLKNLSLKNFNELNKNKLLDQSTVKMKENTKLFLRAQTHSFLYPESKKIMLQEIADDFKNFDIDMTNAGITGIERTKLNENLINNAIDLGELAVYQNGYTPDQARKLVDFLANSIPGSSKGKSLKSNPKWIEASTKFYSDMYNLEITAAERPAKLKKIDEQNAFTKDIENYRNETDPTLKSQKYEALKLNYPRKEFQSDIDEDGQLDNKPFMEKAKELKKKITRGRFFVDGTPDKGSAFLELDKLEKLDLTPDSETEEELEKIEKAIKGMASYSNNLDSIEDDIINQVKDALKEKGFGGGFLNNTNSKLISRFARILKDEADQEMSDFIDEKDRPMTRLEIKQMYRRLEDLLFLEVDILNEDEVGVRVPQINAIGIEGDIPNPFSDARRKPKKNKSNSSNNEILNNQELFDTPQLKSQSSNVLDNTKIVSDVGNPVMGIEDGDLIAMARTNTKEEIDSTNEEPKILKTGNGIERMETNFPVIYNLAKKIGIKFPEIVAAQFGLESSHGAKLSGKNNYLGIKATQKEIADGKATLVKTKEIIDGKEVVVDAYFKDFDSLEEMLLHYKEQWNDNYKDRKGIINSKNVEEAIKLLKANDYATDPKYDTKILNIIKSAKANPSLF
tara:strand:+ start:3440 stop:5875 length:2436 start_codon:yes stop_codon:yes gene_type:complete